MINDYTEGAIKILDILYFNKSLSHLGLKVVAVEGCLRGTG